MSMIGLIAPLFLSALAAAVPTALWTALVWWCDRYEREPLPLATATFFWGALPAVALSLAMELLLGTSSLTTGHQLLTQVISSSAVAPVVEETAKAGALLLIVVFWRNEIDDVLDGILYGALIGFGFAMTENLFYFLGAVGEGGWSTWGVTVFMRGALFGLNHAFFTAFTGAALGYARLTRDRRRALIVPFLGLLAAILAHAAHNFGTSMAAVSPLAILLSLASDGGGILLVAAMIALSLRQERLWIVTELSLEVGRLLTADEVEMVSSVRGRAQRLAVARHSGWRAIRATQGFQQTATELAFCRHRTRKHGLEVGMADRMSQLERRLVAERAAMVQFTAAPPAAV